MRWIALVGLVAAVAVAAAIGGGRSAVATAILLPAGVAMLVVLWRAVRAAHRQRGFRRAAAYAAVVMLTVIELVVFSMLIWFAAAVGEGLFPFDVDEHARGA